MSYAIENKENCIFLDNLQWVTFVKLFFQKEQFFNEKIEIEREQYPVRKRGQLSPEWLKKWSLNCAFSYTNYTTLCTNKCLVKYMLSSCFYDRLLSYEYIAEHHIK